jgi:hypothetical protein
MKESEKKDLNKPKAGAGDIVHAAIRTTLSVVPVIGGPAKELEFKRLMKDSVGTRNR